jgi:aryl-alcohol dehydrogenase-like predicted oxidoreductase
METINIIPLKTASSRICLGTWAIGGWSWGGTDEQESIKTIHTALDNGINIIDTAPVYGFGVSEQIVGKALQQYGNRDRIIISTKVGLEWKNNNVYRNSTPARIKQEIEDSLQRLQTDYIDIYLIHWPDPLVPIEETAEAMLALFKQGKIRAIGVSNYSVVHMQMFQKIAPIHVSQLPYNLFEREIENEALPFTEKNGIVTLAYGALCRGLLSGKMNQDRKFTGDDLRKTDPKFQLPRFKQYLNAVAALEEFAQRKYQKSVLALAVRWILDKGLTVALWGARHPTQLLPVDEIMGWSINSDEMQQIDKILKDNITDPIGPEFMAPPARDY